ncbi:MAG: hypothetical protein E6K18_03965 [Methanobacteriota archaeon]|nr:MAG: hypothetical protein E6K18_03965 [Euryarchaeota archaeon]
MTPEMEAVLLRSEEAVQEDQYREAIDAIRALEETIERARDEKAAAVQRKDMERAKKASDRFVRVRRMVEELKKANIDIQGSDEALVDSERALQGRDFDRVDLVLGDLEETAREMRAELIAATKFLISKAREAVQNGERQGVDVAEAKSLLESADGFLAKGKLDDAVESANTAKQRVDAALRLRSEDDARKEKLRVETARQKIDRMKQIMADLNRADITVDGMVPAIEQAEEALAAKRFEEVHVILAESESLAESLHDGLRMAAEELIKKSRDSVEVAKKEGLNVKRADMVLTNAAEAIKDRRFVEAIEYHKVIDDIVDDAKRVRQFRELEADVQVLRTDLLRMAALGGNTQATEELLQKAQAEVALGRYDRVAEYTDQIRAGIKDARKQVLEAKLDRARIAIGKAELLGAVVDDAKALMPDAEKALADGNYEALDVLVKRIEEKAAKASESFLAAKAEEDYLGLQDLAKQVSASGLDVPQAREFLDEARKLKDERQFESMAQMITEARRVLEASSLEHVVAEHRKKMRGLAAMLEAAKRIGASVGEAERILLQAEAAIESKDLALADILVKQAEVSTGLQIQSFIQNKYPNLVVKMPTGGLQANAWNKYVVEIANKGAIGAKDIDLKFDGDVEVRGVEPIPELGVDETKAIELGVRPKHEGEVPVNVRVFYNRYFDENRYEIKDAASIKVERAGTYLVEDVFLIHVDGRLVAHESRKFRQEIDEDIFSGMLTVVQDFIRDSFKQRTHTGIKRLDFGQSKILIERSPHCFLASVVLGSEPALLPLYMAEILREIEKKFGDVLNGWSGMLHELPGIDETIRKLVLVTEAPDAEHGALAESEVAELERMLSEAKESGAETSDVEELLSKAENSLDSDMELAWQLLSKAKVQVKESQEKLVDRMELLVEQTAEAVDQLRGLGADAGPAEILLKDAREAFLEGQYEKVEEIAQNVRAALDRAQGDAMSKKVEEDLSALIHEIEQARNEGVDPTRAEAFLVKIEDALQRRNFRAVDDHMRRARDSLREGRKKALLKRSTEEMERLTAMLVEAKAFGAEAGEAEGLLLRAREALADGRAEDLDAIVRQASEVAKQRVQTFLENRYPKLFLSLPTAGFQAESWNKFVFELANKGTIAAKNVDLKFAGDVEVRGLKPIPRIDPNEKKRLEIGVRPKAAGQVPVDVEIRYFRPLDERAYELTDSKHIKAERPGTYQVEDAFLIHRDGRLIHHESRRFRDSMDEDIFSGMLTVVLNHVKETMQSRAQGGLRRIDFGGNKILFERGPSVYLAATVAGGEPVVLPIYMVDTLREIEERFGERLTKWTGFLTELEGIEELVRRLLYVTEAPEADLGPLAGSPLAETMRLVAEAAPEDEGAGFVEEARTVIESKDFAEASEFVQKAVASYKVGREELHAQLREAVMTHGEMTGLQVSDDQMQVYIDTVRRVVEAVFAARDAAGMDKVWPVKRVAVKVDKPETLDAVQSFRKIIVTQAGAKELDIVAPGDTWRGLKLHLNLDSEAISKAYRVWARKIEILLRSQDAWKIKQGLDKGEYHVGVEGQKVRIDPSMVWFTEAVPDHVVEEPFDGGKVYVDTEMTEDILAEGYARELVNIIRDVRGDLKLPRDVWIETKIRASENLNKLLKKWKDFISHETNTQALRFVRGDITDGYVVECNLGTENFTISVRPAEAGMAA